MSAHPGFDTYSWTDAAGDIIGGGETIELMERRYNVLAHDSNGCYWPSVAPVIGDFEECNLVIPNIITSDDPSVASISQSNDNNAFFVKSLRLYPNSQLIVYNH